MPPYTKPPSPRRRDTAASSMATTLWSPGGESYARQRTAYVGSAGQDLHRFVEGPSHCLHGRPNASQRYVNGLTATLAKVATESPRGKVTYGKFSGPASFTPMAASRKMACLRSRIGPDPYALRTGANLWTPRPGPLTGQRAFTPSVGRTPFVLGAGHDRAFDPHHSTCVNEWRQMSHSNSIKSLLAPPMPQTPLGSALLPVHREDTSSGHSRSGPLHSHRLTPQRPTPRSREPFLQRPSSVSALPSARMEQVYRMAESFALGEPL